jgi:hypothetical protein
VAENADKRSVSEQIPPEARRRAARAHFSARADWYSGRIYEPPPRPRYSRAERRERDRKARAEMKGNRAAAMQVLADRAKQMVSSAGRRLDALRGRGHRARHP